MIDRLFESLRAEGIISAEKKAYEGRIRDAYAEGYAEGAMNELTRIVRLMQERGQTAESIAGSLNIRPEDINRVIAGRYEQPKDWF